MKMKVVITPDNQVLVSVLEGTFEEARLRIAGTLQALGLDKLPLVMETAIEQHRHDDEHVHAKEHLHGN